MRVLIFIYIGLLSFAHLSLLESIDLSSQEVHLNMSWTPKEALRNQFKSIQEWFQFVFASRKDKLSATIMEDQNAESNAVLASSEKVSCRVVWNRSYHVTGLNLQCTHFRRLQRGLFIFFWNKNAQCCCSKQLFMKNYVLFLMRVF